MIKSLAVACLVLLSTQAYAASDDAWAEFRTEVETGCATEAADVIKDAQIVVDPFGSETYGMALLTGEVSPGVTKSVICVFDKKTKAVEIGGELDVPAAASAK